MPTPVMSSVRGESYAEYVIKKSKFIARAVHITTEEEAQAYLRDGKKQYWDARHNCYAYQLGMNFEKQKSSDDGEPSGTAGKPILEVLKNKGLTNTLIVVTRYFGGIKLGTGGPFLAFGAITVRPAALFELTAQLPLQPLTMRLLKTISTVASYIYKPIIPFYPQQSDCSRTSKLLLRSATLRTL